jgi:hypothetical protein
MLLSRVRVQMQDILLMLMLMLHLPQAVFESEDRKVFSQL